MVGLHPALHGHSGRVYAYAAGYLPRSRSTGVCRRASRWSARTSVCSCRGSARQAKLAQIVGLDLADPAIRASGIDALSRELRRAGTSPPGPASADSRQPPHSAIVSVVGSVVQPGTLAPPAHLSKGSMRRSCSWPRSSLRSASPRVERHVGREGRGYRADGHHRGNLPADGPRRTRHHSARDEGVLLVHQLAEGAGRQARRLRPADRVQVLRRRLQPRQLGAAHAEARRGGQGVRGRRLARHRRERVDQAVPQRPEGAAASQCDRRVGVRGREAVPLDRRLAPAYDYESRIYDRRSRTTANAKSPSSTRTTTGGGNLDGLKGSAQSLEHRRRSRTGDRRSAPRSPSFERPARRSS